MIDGRANGRNGSEGDTGRWYGTIARRPRWASARRDAAHYADATARIQPMTEDPPLPVTRPAPVVSILTPTYNHERFIAQCIQSAIDQTDRRWEQFVVDDGSTDATGSIVESYADERLHYIRMPHRGILHLAESYNLALERATGEFVAVLEGDDFWPPDKIERQIRLFEDPDIVLNFGLAHITDEAGAFLFTVPSARVAARANGRARGPTLRALLESNFISAGAVMCRRDALLRVGGFHQPEGVSTADYPTWLQLLRVGRFSSTVENLGYQRNHPTQVTQRLKDAIDRTQEYGPAFVESLSPAEREELGITVDDALRILERRRAYLSYEAARAALVAGDRRAAKRGFRAAARHGSTPTRLKGAIGLLAAYLGLDFETIAAVAKRVPR